MARTYRYRYRYIYIYRDGDKDVQRCTFWIGMALAPPYMYGWQFIYFSGGHRKLHKQLLSQHTIAFAGKWKWKLWVRVPSNHNYRLVTSGRKSWRNRPQLPETIAASRGLKHKGLVLRSRSTRTRISRFFEGRNKAKIIWRLFPPNRDP